MNGPSAFIYNLVWEVRERSARFLIYLAHKLDDDSGVNIYRGDECQKICMKIWRGELSGQELRDEIYAALY